MVELTLTIPISYVRKQNVSKIDHNFFLLFRKKINHFKHFRTFCKFSKRTNLPDFLASSMVCEIAFVSMSTITARATGTEEFFCSEKNVALDSWMYSAFCWGEMFSEVGEAWRSSITELKSWPPTWLPHWPSCRVMMDIAAFVTLTQTQSWAMFLCYDMVTSIFSVQ